MQHPEWMEGGRLSLCRKPYAVHQLTSLGMKHAPTHHEHFQRQEESEHPERGKHFSHTLGESCQLLRLLHEPKHPQDPKQSHCAQDLQEGNWEKRQHQFQPEGRQCKEVD
eukprot:CAMPEP_0119315456 /NCGR_PEP_ID=MMETSP1333-20130426/35951_1 /TAXON_ID=418940 /ORGANISM="Scyphosphaera apsteinii, Strain RCC1455" /LENGTH=109 /DNA_ID=CAMNT_0007320821 /DNA_START=689 /DNA_END=1019 /DNA_ORIENTATION=+